MRHLAADAAGGAGVALGGREQLILGDRADLGLGAALAAAEPAAADAGGERRHCRSRRARSAAPPPAAHLRRASHGPYVPIASRRPCPNTCPVSCGPVFPTRSSPVGALWYIVRRIRSLASGKPAAKHWQPECAKSHELQPPAPSHGPTAIQCPSPPRPAAAPRLTSCWRRPAASAPASTAPSRSSSWRCKKFGAPVYVRHEIVHNRHVVESLKAKGAIFVEELDEIPETGAPVIFSAHGVPQSVPAARQGPQHVLPRRHLPAGLQGARRGPAHHEAGPRDRADRPCRPPEVVGTLGQLPPDAASAGRDRRRCPRLRAARPRAPRLHHADHPVGRRHGRHRRHPQGALSRPSSARARRTSATPPPTARRP